MILLILIGVGGGYYYYDSNTKPVSNDPTMIEFEVPEGSTVDSVTKKLEAEGFVRHAFISKYLISQEEFDTVKSGSFEISPSMTPQEIFSVITNSENIIVHTYRMQFIDGEWARDYAQVIANNTGLTPNDILAKWNDVDYLQTLIDAYEVLTPEIINDQTRVYLEGYFSPNTYEFYQDATLEEITKTLLDPTEKFYQDNKALFDQSPLTIHEVFKLASLVHHEARFPEDQQLVASVFFNRMVIDMPLGASASVCYALYDFDSWQDCETNTQIDSPYNTYTNLGLPVGPISNPNHNSLMSVLSPIESNYYYFVSDVHGVEEAGRTFFAETYEEHLQLIERFNLNLNQ